MNRLLNFLLRRRYGVWDQRYGWITYRGSLITEFVPGRLDSLVGSDPLREVRRIPGTVLLEHTTSTDNEVTRDEWSLKRDR